VSVLVRCKYVWCLVGAGDVQDVVTDWSFALEPYSAQNLGELVTDKRLSREDLLAFSIY
jgi:hypothetical protein